MKKIYKVCRKYLELNDAPGKRGTPWQRDRGTAGARACGVVRVSWGHLRDVGTGTGQHRNPAGRGYGVSSVYRPCILAINKGHGQNLVSDGQQGANKGR